MRSEQEKPWVITVRLCLSLRRKARKLGDGNVSAGVRKALEQASTEKEKA